MRFIKQHWLAISISAILLLSILLRFYGYSQRWGLAYDQAHDALVARYALQEGKIPLVGPFSSAGPFQTGGVWYWFIMFGTMLYPLSVISPWVFLTISTVFFVYLLYVVGKEIGGKYLGLIAALLGSVSQSQVMQSTNLTNQSPISLYSLLSIWAAILLLKTKKSFYVFLLGLFVSCAFTTHFQGVLLLIFIMYVFVFLGYPKIKTIGLFFFGFVIPIVPLLMFDLQNDFVNVKGFLQYYFVDQYKISYDALGRRWITYLFQFWPKMLAYIIGGYSVISEILIIGLLTAGVFSIKTKKISRYWLLISLSFVSFVIAVRYVRTPIFDSYLMFINPFVFLLTAGLLYVVCKKQLFIGVIAIVCIVLGSLYKDIIAIPLETNTASIQAISFRNVLIDKFPEKKFAIFDMNYKTTNISLPLALYLYEKNLIDDNGVRIGIGYATTSARLKSVQELSDNEPVQLYNLSTSSAKDLKKEEWVFVNPSAIYYSTEEWYNNKRK